ncbi:flagellar protein FliS [Lachnospiraceae bacterium KH1T2]|nr:flagellar protein FliS [Lachnospiraceae bacterium KH1T2]
MTPEKKQDYTRRITQANKTEISVITYEIALDYLNEAKEAASEEEFESSIKHSKRCVEQLRDALNMDYAEISLPLARLYNYVTLEFDKAVMKRDRSNLGECEMILNNLHDSFVEVAKQDVSDPVMKNTEQVFSGLTYGPEGANDMIDQEKSRGFMA